MSDTPADTGSGPSQGSPRARFRTSLLAAGKTATGIEVPPEVVERLGGGKRPAVVVTIGSYTYRSTVGVMAGRSLIPVSADNRRQAGIAAGDDIDVALELDTVPRRVELPADLAEALSKDDAARQFFDRLSASQKKWHIQSVESAKTPETRQRRIGKSMEMLRQRQARLPAGGHLPTVRRHATTVWRSGYPAAPAVGATGLGRHHPDRRHEAGDVWGPSALLLCG